MSILKYKEAATQWVEALPIGNGHMGAMVYGGQDGLYDLSENTCWSGKASVYPNSEKAKGAMGSARQLLLQGDIAHAEGLLMQECCLPKDNYGTQLPMGKLNVSIGGAVTAHARQLCLDTGVAKETLVVDGKEVIRESFISNPDKIMCVRVSAKGSLPVCNVWVQGYSNPSKTVEGEHSLTVYGRALENIHSDGLTGVLYKVQMEIITDGVLMGGRDTTYISNATEIVLLIACHTNFFDEDYEAITQRTIERAKSRTYDELKSAHIKEHSELMGRFNFDLPKTQNSTLYTDERLERYKDDESDLDLIATFFKFGRYVLINSSRKDSVLPAALQGVWNDNRACRMEWTDDMHLDINTQMNYYPAHVTGIGECNLPLLKWIKNILMPNGTQTAKNLYGADGWVAHTISNAHGFSAPGWDVRWGVFVTGGAWVALSVWEYYKYTLDKDFLMEYYEVLLGCAQFLSSLLVREPKDGLLVISPSYSPENFYIPNGDTERSMCVGSTVDTTITKCIFNAVIDACKVLGKDDDVKLQLAQKMGEMPGYKIGKDGRFMEWLEEYIEAAEDHRHTCHLLSMHPFNMVDPKYEPHYKAAIEKSIDRRLGENAQDIVLANWAGALLITYYARLLEPEKAGDFIKPMMKFLARKNLMITHEGPLTLNTGGIYELDGNTGLTAAICEMLLQSYTDEVRILPAVPKSWSEGSFSGLVIPKGHRVACKWCGKTVRITVSPTVNDSLKLVYKDKTLAVSVKKGEDFTAEF